MLLLTEAPTDQSAYPIAPNLLARQCDVEQPNQVWVGDITDVWTAEGWLYRAVLVDLSSRSVVGWALHQHRDTTLVQAAWPTVRGHRSPSAGFRHHADRGSQDASHAYPAM